MPGNFWDDYPGESEVTEESMVAARRQVRDEAAQWRFLRPEVQRFAVLMEKKLRKNEHKGGWKGMIPTDLMQRVYAEFRELWSSVDHHVNSRWGTDRKDIANEAADVANFCMMVADVCGGLKEE